MNQSPDSYMSGADAVRRATTRRRVVYGLASGAIGAGLLSSLRIGASAQEATPQPAAPDAPRLEWIGSLTAQFGPPTVIGETSHGTRMVIPVADGTFDGPGVSGSLLPMSGDWMLVRPDGVAEIDARATLQTQDGALVYIVNRGYITNVLDWLPRWSQGEEIAPDEYYYALNTAFETGAPQYDWLQRTVVVGTGVLLPGGTRQDLFAVR